MDCARVMAYSSKLLRFLVFGIVRIEDGFGGPYPYVAIYKVLISLVPRDRHRAGEVWTGC